MKKEFKIKTRGMYSKTEDKPFKVSRSGMEAYDTTQSIYVSGEWSFGNDTLADNLKQLVLNGKKTATTGFLKPSTVVPKTGNYSAILDSKNRRFCIIQYTNVEIKSFLEVDYAFAELEGEGDANIEDWRKKHRDYFNKYYEGFSDDSKVVCSQFKLVHTMK